MEKIQEKSRSVRWMVIGFIMCLISGIGVSAIQTSGGVEMNDMTFQSAEGHDLSGYIFVPPNATPETPAPAIVAVHGWYNSKEMQDAYYVELARRGYVVLALDMNSHGNSESLDGDHLYDGALGVHDAVTQLATMDFVDKDKIGLTGHSSGGGASNMAIQLDNERDQPLISANMLQAADWLDEFEEDTSDSYGSRSIGIVADRYDSFYYWFYNDDGELTSVPRDFLGSDQAKWFLGFGDDASSFDGTPEEGKYYTKAIDGVESQRVIYTPNITHAMVPFSTTATTQVLDFFDSVFGAPNPIPSSDLIWPWKTAFNLLGLIGFFTFMTAAMIALTRTRFFAEVSRGRVAGPQPSPRGVEHAWFWGGLLVSAIFSGLAYLYMVKVVGNAETLPDFWPQRASLMTASWAAVCGLFGVLLLVLTYYVYSKKNGLSPRETGLSITWRAAWKTVALAIVVFVATYALVFMNEFFFKSDFRFWVLGIKAFGPDKIGVALGYLPLFLLYFVVNSVAVNCFNYVKLTKHEWVNTVIIGFAANIAPIVLLVLQYGTFFVTGSPWDLSYSSSFIRLIPVTVILFGAVVVSRIVYKRTKNPYLPGLVNGMIVTMLTIAASTTILKLADVNSRRTSPGLHQLSSQPPRDCANSRVAKARVRQVSRKERGPRLYMSFVDSRSSRRLRLKLISGRRSTSPSSNTGNTNARRSRILCQ